MSLNLFSKCGKIYAFDIKILLYISSKSIKKYIDLMLLTQLVIEKLELVKQAIRVTLIVS